MRRDYRLLKEGEPRMVGDEFLTNSESGPYWLPLHSVLWAEDIIAPFRRPATGPASAGQMIEVLEAENKFLRELLEAKK